MKDSSKFFAGTLGAGPDRIERFKLDSPGSIGFIGEQDGEAERPFKAAVAAILKKHKSVDLAYLARVQYAGEGDWSVGLCLAFGSDGLDESAIVESLEVFAKMFDRTEHLDAVPLNSDQQRLIRLVCKPFYVRDKA